MTVLLAKVALAHDSGEIVDMPVMDFTVRTSNPLDVFDANDHLLIGGLLEDFFTQSPSGQVAAPQTWMSKAVGLTGGQVRLYDITAHLAGTNYGAPVYIAPLTLTATGTTGLPHEVAYKVTLEAFGRDAAPVEVGNTRPKARYTGGFYFGPLSKACVDDNVTAMRPVSQLGPMLRQAVVDLHAGFQALLSVPGTLAVWSRSDALARAVEFVSTDNAFDTIRSRGVAPTARVRESLV